MAKIRQFEERARRAGVPAISLDTGATDAYQTVAQVTGELAGQVGKVADRAAAIEGHRAGLLHGSGAGLPGVSVSGGEVTTGDGKQLDVVSRIIQIESGGKATAKNKSSSAAGLGQFIGSTWLSMIRTYRPDILKGRTTDQVLALRTDPRFADLSVEMTANYARQNQRGLEKSRLPVTAGSTYLAHFLGLGGARRVLRATPGTPIVNVVGSEVVRANQRVMKGKTVGQVIAWADGKMKGAKTVVPASSSPVDIAFNETPTPAFQLTQGISIRDRAFDQAARSVYLDRVDTAARTEIAALSDLHPDDPDALATALDNFSKGYKRNLEDPEARVQFERTFERQKIAAVRAASSRAQKLQRDENQAAFEENYSTRRTAILRLAREAGNDDKANEALTGELEELEGAIEGAGGLSAVGKGRLRRELLQDVARSRLLGGFDRQDGPAAREQYLADFVDRYNKGDDAFKDITPENFDRLQTEMQRSIAKDRIEQGKQIRLVDRQIDGVMDRVKKGFAVPGEERDALRARVQALGDPVLNDAFSFFERLTDWQSAHRDKPPEVIAAQIAALDEEIAEKGATSRALVMRDVMAGLEENMREGLKKDPLEFAERAGVLDVPDLDFSNADILAVSLMERSIAAEIVADQYSIDKRFFKAGEAERLTELVADDPERLSSVAKAIREGIGTADTPDALAELSKSAPVVAHAAGLAMATGSDDILRETTQGLHLRGIEGYEPIRLKPAARRSTTGQFLGASVMALPETEGAAVNQAEILFERRAREMRLDPVADPESAKELWESALDESLGGRVVDGRKVGGIGEVNGTKTLLPPDMSEEDVSNLLSRLSDAELASLPEIVSANGVPVGARDVRRGRLVAVGQGRYRVALGDPTSGDPRWLAGSNGEFWVLDLNRLAVQRAKPSAPEPFNPDDHTLFNTQPGGFLHSLQSLNPNNLTIED